MAGLVVQFGAVLAPLVPLGGAWYQFNAREPGAQPTPYIVWQLVGGDPNASLGGLPTQRTQRVQVDIFGPDILAIEAVSDALHAAADATMARAPDASTALRFVPLSEPTDLFEDAVQLRRRTCDFDVTWQPT